MLLHLFACLLPAIFCGAMLGATLVLQEKLGKYADRADRENGIVKDVLVCGLQSAKGYDYDPTALRKAMPMYEGAKVHYDHAEPGARRSYRDNAGTIRNVRFVEGQGIRGDLHLNQKHPQYEQLMWDAENNPNGCGLSHDTRGSTVNRGGRRVVEKIDKVVGVDLVSRPATVSGLYESMDDDSDDPSPFSHLRPRQSAIGESTAVVTARIHTTVEKYTRHTPLEDVGEVELTEDVDDTPRAINEPVAPFVPPSSAPLMTRLRRFQ